MTITDQSWHTFSYAQQMVYIGNEIAKARICDDKGDVVGRNNCLEEALHLINMTKDDRRFSGHLKEVCRLYEVLADKYGDLSNYDVSLIELEKYCLEFSVIANRNR